MGLNFQFRVSLNRQWAAQKLRMPPDETRWAEYTGRDAKPNVGQRVEVHHGGKD